MMAITTSSSMSVKPRDLRGERSMETSLEEAGICKERAAAIATEA
jgi:hypothetical protein